MERSFLLTFNLMKVPSQTEGMLFNRLHHFHLFAAWVKAISETAFWSLLVYCELVWQASWETSQPVGKYPAVIPSHIVFLHKCFVTYNWDRMQSMGKYHRWLQLRTQFQEDIPPEFKKKKKKGFVSWSSWAKIFKNLLSLQSLMPY